MVENSYRKPLTLDSLDDEERDFTMHAGGAETCRYKAKPQIDADIISQNIMSYRGMLTKKRGDGDVNKSMMN